MKRASQLICIGAQKTVGHSHSQNAGLCSTTPSRLFQNDINSATVWGRAPAAGAAPVPRLLRPGWARLGAARPALAEMPFHAPVRASMFLLMPSSASGRLLAAWGEIKLPSKIQAGAASPRSWAPVLPTRPAFQQTQQSPIIELFRFGYTSR